MLHQVSNFGAGSRQPQTAKRKPAHPRRWTGFFIAFTVRPDPTDGFHSIIEQLLRQDLLDRSLVGVCLLRAV